MIVNVPVIQGWTVHANRVLPMALKTSPSLSPVWRVRVPQPGQTVALCGSKPVLLKVMTWPTFAAIIAGLNSKSAIETLTTPGSPV